MEPTKPSLLSEAQRKAAIDKIINHFATERDEELGIIAAEDILDMFLDEIAKDIYNKGVEDTKDYYKNNFEALETDIEISLKKS